MADNKNVAPFPSSDEEKAGRVIAEAERLSRQSVLERNFWMKRSAERLGINVEELKILVEAAVKEREKKEAEAKAEERRQEQRVESQRAGEEKKRLASERTEERRRKAEQEAIEKAAQAKEKAKQKALADIAKLPVAQHQTKLVQLATKLDLDLYQLRDEFSELIDEGKETSEPLWAVELWPEPVPTVVVLSELVAKISKHVAAEPHEILVIALWAMMTWVHQDAARHSAFLVITSSDPDFGKTTVLEVLGFTALRPSHDTDITGPTLYRFIDQIKPTMLLDETEDLLKRRDIKAIVLKSHSRDGTIKRQERVAGRLVTVRFSPFCPKAFALIELNVPAPLISRSITIQVWAKLPNSKVSFDHVDDEEFAGLRQKLARWASDEVPNLKQAKEPLFPTGFDNRLADLWRLLLSIAELAGGNWPQRARKAAERLSRSHPTPSWRRRLLETIAKMAADRRRYVLSESLIDELLGDPTSPWQEYENRRGRISKVTQRQVAHLLEGLQIRPTACGPRRLRGYLISDFHKAFKHYRIHSSTLSQRKVNNARKLYKKKVRG
jgi:flagellar biosynthesis GTPase FlhF